MVKEFAENTKKDELMDSGMDLRVNTLNASKKSENGSPNRSTPNTSPMAGSLAAINAVNASRTGNASCLSPSPRSRGRPPKYIDKEYQCLNNDSNSSSSYHTQASSNHPFADSLVQLQHHQPQFTANSATNGYDQAKSDSSLSSNNDDSSPSKPVQNGTSIPNGLTNGNGFSDNRKNQIDTSITMSFHGTKEEDVKDSIKFLTNPETI